MTKLTLPKKMLDWIDEQRGALSRQVFIIRSMEQQMTATQVATDSHFGDNNGTTTKARDTGSELL